MFDVKDSNEVFLDDNNEELKDNNEEFFCVLTECIFSIFYILG